mgnify:CR=1 FL=1
MNLGKKYKQIFEGRKKDYFTKLNEDDFQPGDDYGGGPSPGGSDEPGGGPEPLDIEYYSDQINEVLTAMDDFHQAIGTDIEQKSETSGNYQYDTMEKQVSRYVSGARKQLEGLQKYLERQKGKGL